MTEYNIIKWFFKTLDASRMTILAFFDHVFVGKFYLRPARNEGDEEGRKKKKDGKDAASQPESSTPSAR